MSIQNHAILLPVCAQVFLTFLVWVWMYYLRIGTILRSKIDVQDLDDDTKATKLLKHVVNPSDNFENLFEMPVLFYVACIMIFVTGLGDRVFVNLAWTFVGLRTVHSLVHSTYNRIIHRFTAYVLSSMVLLTIWVRIACHLVHHS